jgi:hypothetical protein
MRARPCGQEPVRGRRPLSLDLAGLANRPAQSLARDEWAASLSAALKATSARER